MSKQRNFRPRSKLSFEEEEGQADAAKPAKPSAAAAASGGAAPARASAAAARPIARDGSKPSLLSFDDDGGEEGPLAVPAVRKKDRESKGKFKRAQGLPDLPPVAALQPAGAGEYTADKIKELQRNALSFSAAKFSEKQDADGVPAPLTAAKPEPLIKLSGSFKPAGLPKDDRFSINPTALVKEEPRSGGSMPPPSPGALPASSGGPAAMQAGAPGTAARVSGTSTGVPVEMEAEALLEEGEEGEDEGPVIPDEEMIRMAKAKRERLRQAHLAPDYIPLGGASRLLASSKPSSRLPELGGEVVEAASGSDEEAELEDAMRIKFSVKGEDRADRKGYAKSLATAPEEDEQAFAEEQLRKAVRRSQAAMPSQQPATTTTTSYTVSTSYGPGGVATAGYAAATTYTADGQAAYYEAATTTTGQGTSAAVAYGTGMLPGAGYAAAAPGYASGSVMGGGPASGGLARSRMDAIMHASGGVMAALREGVARLTASHKASQSNLNKTSNLLTASLGKIDTLEQESKAAAERYTYVQEFKAYIADLVECLADKSLLVEELEDSLQQLREERADSARATAQALEDEMLRPAQAAISAALGVLGRGGALPAAQQAAENAADAEEEAIEDEQASGPVELDEFGRNVNLGRQREAQERRRQRAAAIKRETEYLKTVALGQQTTVDDGALEVESDAQAARYASRHQEIMTAAETVFADTGEDFASLQAVKRKLEDFKARYPKDYSNTYMHLSCTALFAPFVRLELLRWDPLYADQRRLATDVAGVGQTDSGTTSTANGAAAPVVHKGFDKQAWYEQLFDYGMGGNAAAMSVDDPDAELVPQLVRKLVLPLAIHMLVKCWDPLVLQQSQAAAAIVGDLLVYVPAEEEGMAELLDVVVSALNTAVSRVALPAWPPVALAAAPMAEAVLSRRFRSAVRLLRGLGVWEGLLSRSLLINLALDKVVSQQLLAYLRAAVGAHAATHTAVLRLEHVAGALPTEWFADGCPPEAAPLIELMASLATSLEMQKDNKERFASPATRLARSLHRLGEQARAARLASAFGMAL